MYALDPSFRCEYEKRCAETVGSFCGWNFEINTFDDELEPIENMVSNYIREKQFWQKLFLILFIHEKTKILIVSRRTVKVIARTRKL